ncbi:CPBP family intramembrane glutamic endopeptidase [Microlunatus parietis]|uniref:Membrane protease YdiL (CAAX protease family) n=1 Tax=Microlunatus parietis TaxID=682979 RepID=A0A7Y9I5L5_9ACTN|nr:type II CAAX endopeptidase family protein [Microlunatus parietis]NYE70129.1 membrane protease YdiL (CAAX protease family) [Microlunatus parietis]
MTAAEQASEAETPAPPRFSWGLIPAAGVSASAVLLFGVQHQLSGYLTLAISIVVAMLLDRDLGKSLLLIGIGLAPIGLISLEADISWFNFLRMGGVLAFAASAPYLIDRFILKRHVIRFPVNTGRRWTRLERWYLVVVVALAWLILPFYFIRSGTYLNWPAVHETSELIRLGVAVNAVGLWDELFFICTAFALFRRHFPMWQANILQSIIFVSFLWELGYQSWGPLLTIPFTLVQGYIFKRTRSLPYVVCTHLIFDCVLWFVLVHAHNPGWLPIFIY